MQAGSASSCYNRALNLRDNYTGREDELELLLDRWSRCLQGKGSCVIVLGETGVGKTRLLDEMEKRVRLSSEVSICRADFRPERDRPLMPFLRALDRFKKQPSSLSSTEDWTEAWPEVEKEDDELLFFDRYLQDLMITTGSTPLLLRVEDIQWADSSSLRFIRFLARRSPEYPLMLVATAREEELVWKDGEKKGTTEDLLKEISLEGDSIVLHLHNLDRFDAATMLSRSLPKPLGSELSDAIFEESEGNPLFALWYLEVLLDSGQLIDKEGYVYAKDRMVSIIPKGVTELIQNRLQPLAEEELKVVQVASIIGTNFNASWLEPFFPHDDSLDLLDAVQRKARVICCEEGAYRFTHELFRLAVYDDIPIHLREGMHAILGEWLERTGTYVPLGYIADQFELGGREEKARLYSWRAGREFLDHFAAEEALHYFQRVAQTSPSKDILWTGAMEGAADSHFQLGHYQEAADTYDLLYHEFTSIPDKDRMLVHQVDCWVPGRLGKGKPVKMEELLSLVQKVEELRLEDQGNYWSFRSNLCIWNTDYPGGLENSRKALECYSKANRWDKMATELTNQAFNKALQHPLPALPILLAVQEVYDEHPYVRGEMELFLTLGETYLNLGLLHDAFESFSWSLERAKLAGESINIVWNHYYLGLIALLESDYDNALAHVKLSLDTADRNNIRLLTCLPLFVGVVSHVLRSDLIQARVVYQELSRRFNEYRSDWQTMVNGLVVCTREILCAAKNPNHELTRFEEGTKMLEAGQFSAMYKLITRYLLGFALVDRGRRNEAIHQWNKAYQLADEMCNIPMLERICLLLEEQEPIPIIDHRDLL